MSATLAPMQIFPPLDAPTEAALRASIERFGVLVPVTKDQNGRILDGHHRARIAREVGVDYGVRVRRVANEEEATEIARTLNEDRRHLTIEQRLPIVAALKSDGHSNVAIGKALKVSEGTVRNDLKSDELRSTTKLPARTVGLDGKSRPATREAKTNGSRPLADTARGRSLAETAKRRVEKAVGTCNAIARGTGEIRVEWALTAADLVEIAGWDAAFRDAITALKKLRKRLREEGQ